MGDIDFGRVSGLLAEIKAESKFLDKFLKDPETYQTGYSKTNLAAKVQRHV